MSRIEGLRHVAGLAGIETAMSMRWARRDEPGEEVLSPLIAAFGLPVDPAMAAALSEETGAAARLATGPIAPQPRRKPWSWRCACRGGRQ